MHDFYFVYKKCIHSLHKLLYLSFAISSNKKKLFEGSGFFLSNLAIHCGAYVAMHGAYVVVPFGFAKEELALDHNILLPQVADDFEITVLIVVVGKYQ